MFAVFQQIHHRLISWGRQLVTWLETPVELPCLKASQQRVKHRRRPTLSERLESRLRNLKPPPEVRFRPFEPADAVRCLELYRLNETGRFPKGICEMYERTLAETPEGYMVVELDGRIVATCGVCRDERIQNGILSYGLIEPASQGRSIGTAMVLVRLALLGRLAPEVGMEVYLWAVTGSAPFYERLGFMHLGRLPRASRDDPDQFTMLLRLTPHLLKVCEDTLARWGIEVPPMDVRQVQQTPTPDDSPQGMQQLTAQAPS